MSREPLPPPKGQGCAGPFALLQDRKMCSILLPGSFMKSMPLRISSELVVKARAEADASDRSVTAQVEHWLKLGMALEDILTHRQIAKLKGSRGTSIDDGLALARSPAGRKLAREHLRASRQPRYGSDPAFPGRIVRVAPDGTKTPGRLVKRVFIPDDR